MTIEYYRRSVFYLSPIIGNHYQLRIKSKNKVFLSIDEYELSVIAPRRLNQVSDAILNLIIPCSPHNLLVRCSPAQQVTARPFPLSPAI